MENISWLCHQDATCAWLQFSQFTLICLHMCQSVIFAWGNSAILCQITKTSKFIPRENYQLFSASWHMLMLIGKNGLGLKCTVKDSYLRLFFMSSSSSGPAWTSSRDLMLPRARSNWFRSSLLAWLMTYALSSPVSNWNISQNTR